MTKRKAVYIAVSLALSILLIGLLVSRIDAAELGRTLARIFIPGLLAYMAIALFGAVLRAWRYRLFLSPRPVRWHDILMATFVRNSFVDLLPARLGSLSLIYVLNKRLGFPFEAATSAFVASFVYDFLTLAPFVVGAALVVGLGTTAISSPALLAVAGTFFVIWVLVLVKLTWFFTLAVRIYNKGLRLFRLEAKKWAAVSKEKLGATAESLAVIQEKRLALPFFVLSLGIRACKYVSIYFLLFALMRSLGFGFPELSFWKLILGITGAELTSALPVKGLAGFGTWESAWALTFGLMNIDQRFAVLSGLGVHLVTNIFEYSLGIGSLIVLAMPFLRRKGL
ncbi:MAG TPA: lysylphosphatidylglycerol synthase transmembrane domain-containing protein [Acidobacteriota bacterium]|nr:lysylphosphatidylglycerol synthase transmembrane domain-containing protein [Acidobacteriota bacterium]